MHKILNQTSEFFRSISRQCIPKLQIARDIALASFKRANAGQENPQVLIWYWGVISYLFSYVVVNWLIRVLSFPRLLSVAISLLAVIYFAWHIFAMYKCRPRKKDLKSHYNTSTNHKNVAYKSFVRKIFLKEPWFKWNPVVVIIVIDVIFLLYFLSKI